MEPMDSQQRQALEERAVKTVPLGPQAQAALLGETVVPAWWAHVEREEPEVRQARVALPEALVHWERPVILAQAVPLALRVRRDP